MPAYAWLRSAHDRRVHNARRQTAAAFPPWLDALLRAVTALERRLALRLPAGGSVLATAIRPDGAPDQEKP